jgi:hypothetical protein
MKLMCLRQARPANRAMIPAYSRMAVSRPGRLGAEMPSCPKAVISSRPGAEIPSCPGAEILSRPGAEIPSCPKAVISSQVKIFQTQAVM